MVWLDRPVLREKLSDPPTMWVDLTDLSYEDIDGFDGPATNEDLSDPLWCGLVVGQLLPSWEFDGSTTSEI